MKNILLVTYFLFLSSCACYYEDIRRDGEILNPTSYTFDFPKLEVRRVLDSCFRLYDYELPPEARKKYQGSFKSLRLLRHQDKLSTVGGFPYRSYVFKNRKGKFLWAYAEYILQVDSIDRNRTRINITLHDSQVTIGRKLGFNPVSNGLTVSRLMDVPSTTIEEYEILKYIGNKLGQKGMPPIHYPRALTKEEILEHFRNGSSLNFPFTAEDIHGW